MQDAQCIDDARAHRNVTVLVLAHAVLGSQIVMLFVVGSLIGQALTPIACLATLPISMTVAGSMLSAPVLSRIMQTHGRRVGFVSGTLFGLMGSIIALIGLYEASFTLFMIGSFLTGIYMAAQGFYRFAAADIASDRFRPRAISYVLGGGLVAALVGPQLVTVTADLFAIPFLGTYLVVIGINLSGVWLFAFLDIPRPTPQDNAPTGRSRAQLWADPTIRTAVICGTISYTLMSLVMTATPLAVVGCGYNTSDAANVVSAHVIAMFGPSFFTGHLINRFGVKMVLIAGLALLAGAAIIGLSGVTLDRFFLALILLGLGWNFSFIGSTALLTAAIRPEERGTAQGFNDMIVFGGVTFASVMSGGLMNCVGGSPVVGWSFVNLATVPFVLMALISIAKLAHKDASGRAPS